MPNLPISGLTKKAAPPYPPAFTNPTTGAMIEILDTTNVSMAATGTNSQIAPGDLLKGFLVAGANVTITESSGLVTISSAGTAPAGTTGQIQTNNGSGGFAALPVPLAVASGGTGAASLAANAVLLGQGTGAVGVVPIGTPGRVLLDQGSAQDPAFQPITGDAGLNSSGVLTIADGAVTLGKQAPLQTHSLMGNPYAGPAAPIPVTLGANLSFSGSTLVAASIPPGGTAGQIQTNDGFGGFGALPVPLPVGSGGTGQANLASHAVLLGAGTSNVAFVAIGTAGRILLDQGSGLDPAFHAVSGDISLDATGATTIQANVVSPSKMTPLQAVSLMGNPTGSTAIPSAITLGANLSFSGATLVAAGVTPGGTTGQIQTNNGAGGFGALPVPLATGYGGTGLTTLTAHAVMLGEGVNPPGFATIGTAGRVLLDQGVSADPAFRAISGDIALDGTGTATIQPASITLAKQAAFAASALMGNPTGSPATPSAITLGANLSFAGSVLSAAGGTPGGTSGQIQTNNGSGGFGALPVPLQVPSGGTGLTFLTPHAVILGGGASAPTFATVSSAGRVLLDQGTSADPAFTTVSGDVAVTGVGATTIQPGSVTLAKQAAFPAVSLQGNPSGSSAAPSAITLGAGLSFSGTTLIATSAGGMTNPMTTTGDVIYGTSTGSPSSPGRLGIGTTGQVLTVASGLPAWSAIAESQVTNLVSDLASKAPINSPTFTGTVTLPAGTVSLQEQAAFPAVSLQGNPTGSAAAPMAITLGVGLSFSGTTLIATSAGGMTNPMTTTGDLIYGTTTGSPANPGRIGIGTAGFILKSVGGVPTWAALSVTTSQVTDLGAWPGSSAIQTIGTLTSGTVPGVLVSGDIAGNAANITGVAAVAHGGTGATTPAAAYNALSPMTTLGDIEYESGANTASRLAGNITATNKFLSQTGTGTVSAAPVWNAIAVGDVPALPASKITSGQLGVTQGGTGLGVLTAHNVLIGNATGAITFAAIGTAGRVLLDQGPSADPAFTAVSGDATLSSSGVLTIAAGAVTLAKHANLAAVSLMGNPTGSAAAPSAITLGAGLSFSGSTLVSSGGGGGMTNPMTTVGDMIYEDGTPTPVRLPGNAGGFNKFLTSQGTGTFPNPPAWNQLVAADVPALPASKITSGQIPVAQGGTGLGTLTANAVVIGQGTSSPAFATTGTVGQILIDQGSGINPAFTVVSGDITINASGVTAIGAGKVTLAKQANFAASSLMGNPNITSGTPSAITLGANLSFSGSTLVATAGLTNPMTSTGDIIYGASGGAPSRLPGNTVANFKFLQSGGTGSAANAPSWALLTASDIPNLDANKITTGLITVPHGGTGQASASAAFNALSPMSVAGDIIIQDNTNNPTRLPGNVSAAKKVLVSQGNGSVTLAPFWDTYPSGSGSPGGSTTQLQYNNAGAFGGASGLTTNGTDLTLGGNMSIPTTMSSSVGVLLKGGVPFIHDFIGTSSANNLFIGSGAGNFTFTTSSGDLGIGYQTLSSLTTGYNNLAIGSQALTALTSGIYNTGIGFSALLSATTTNYMTGIGYRSLNNVSTGAYNTCIGYLTMYYPTDASNNVAIGDSALMGTASATGVSNNVAIGSNAMKVNIGNNSIGIGYYAGAYETGSNTIIVDSQNRTNAANQKKFAPIQAVTSTTLSSQSVQLTGGSITLSSGSTGVAGVDFAALSSTAAQRPCGTVEGSFNTTTDASWSGNLKLYANDVTAARLGMQIQSNGSVPLLGFFGATPVVRPATTGTATGFTAGGTAVGDSSTFTGGTGSTAYRISDIVKALKNLGLLAP